MLTRVSSFTFLCFTKEDGTTIKNEALIIKTEKNFE